MQVFLGSALPLVGTGELFPSRNAGGFLDGFNLIWYCGSRKREKRF